MIRSPLLLALVLGVVLVGKPLAALLVVRLLGKPMPTAVAVGAAGWRAACMEEPRA